MVVGEDEVWNRIDPLDILIIVLLLVVFTFIADWLMVNVGMKCHYYANGLEVDRFCFGIGILITAGIFALSCVLLRAIHEIWWRLRGGRR